MSKEVSKSVITVDPQINILEDVLNTIRFRGSIFFRSQLASPWGFSFDEIKSPRFHISLDGNFVVGTEKGKDTLIEHMEIAMIPHGNMHWIADNPNSQLIPSADAGKACSIGTPLFQTGDITNKLICGVIHYEKDITHPIIDSLPSVLHFSDLDPNSTIWKTVIMIDDLMSDEFSSQTIIIDRLTEVLFLQLLNNYINENQNAKGFFAALKDKRMNKVLSYIHQFPHIQWSLEQLGDKVGMSRSTLIRQFKNNLDINPSTYIRNWRMLKAYDLVNNSNKNLEQIADLVGFSTARTLSKTFLQHFGFTPSHLRKSR